MPDRSMDILEKRDFIQALGTAQLIKDIHTLEAELETLLKQELEFRSKSADHLAGKSDDTPAIKALEAELSASAPLAASGKEMTVDAKKAWLLRQRTENPNLKAAVTKQREATFVQDDLEIKKEMTRKRLDNLKAILSLRCAQINFFAGDIKTSTPVEDEVKNG
jgi:hypothetical protein